MQEQLSLLLAVHMVEGVLKRQLHRWVQRDASIEVSANLLVFVQLLGLKFILINEVYLVADDTVCRQCEWPVQLELGVKLFRVAKHS